GWIQRAVGYTGERRDPQGQSALTAGKHAVRTVLACPDPPQPFRLPDHQAAGLTSAVRGSVAAQVCQQHSTFEATHLLGTAVVIDFIRAPKHPSPCPAKLGHLRHKRQRIQLSARIESRPDLLQASYFDLIAY